MDEATKTEIYEGGVSHKIDEGYHNIGDGVSHKIDEGYHKIGDGVSHKIDEGGIT